MYCTLGYCTVPVDFNPNSVPVNISNSAIWVVAVANYNVENILGPILLVLLTKTVCWPPSPKSILTEKKIARETKNFNWRASVTELKFLPEIISADFFVSFGVTNLRYQRPI